METWLPQGYEVPVSEGNYLRFEEGANKFRILSHPVMGYEYWNTAGKPVRLKEVPTTVPSDIRLDKAGKPERVKHFWAVAVWHYTRDKKGNDTSSVKLLEITQASIQGQIQALAENEDWGDPRTFDLTVTRKGEGLDTEYNTQPSPKKPLSDAGIEAMKNKPINLEALFIGADPFTTSAEVPEIQPSDVPF